MGPFLSGKRGLFEKKRDFDDMNQPFDGVMGSFGCLSGSFDVFFSGHWSSYHDIAALVAR